MRRAAGGLCDGQGVGFDMNTDSVSDRQDLIHDRDNNGPSLWIGDRLQGRPLGGRCDHGLAGIEQKFEPNFAADVVRDRSAEASAIQHLGCESDRTVRTPIWITDIE